MNDQPQSKQAAGAASRPAENQARSTTAQVPQLPSQASLTTQTTQTTQNPPPLHFTEGQQANQAAERNENKAADSTASVLREITDKIYLFHDQQRRGVARVSIGGKKQNWLISSRQFQQLLNRIFFAKCGKMMNRNALADALSMLEGMALFEGKQESVYLRVAPHGQNIIIDLCDEAWRVVEVTAQGWKVLDESPVPFIRTNSMKPLPHPLADPALGTIEPLWEILNVSEQQRPLVIGPILCAFNPWIAYLHTFYGGEQGSAKSTAAKVHRRLVDPSAVPLRSPPREESDLLVQAGNNWCVVLDNISTMPQWLSDALCRLATGGGHSARQLYTDGEEFSMALQRPAIMTGIEDVATRPDLAERTPCIELEQIPEEKRVPEEVVMRKLDAAAPTIFTGILNALSCALKEKDKLKLDKLPRMADAAIFVTAAEPALGWESGTFLKAYRENLAESAIDSVESNAVGVAIMQFVQNKGQWSGEPAQLLKELDEMRGFAEPKPRKWPPTPRALSVALGRLAQPLRRMGVDVQTARGKRRTIKLAKLANFATPASFASSTQMGNDAKVVNVSFGTSERKTEARIVCDAGAM